MSLAGIEDRWIIKAADELVGIVVYDTPGWVFFAATSSVWNLNGKIFEHVQDAEQAVRKHLRGRPISTSVRPNTI